MTPEAAAHCEDDVCITCGDVADPMTVLRIDEQRELALCEAGDGAHQTVEIALVQPVARGDELLVHAGTAIANLAADGNPALNPTAPGREAEEAVGR